MKRIIALILAAVCCFSLIACGGDEEKSNKLDTTAAKIAETADEVAQPHDPDHVHAAQYVQRLQPFVHFVSPPL